MIWFAVVIVWTSIIVMFTSIKVLCQNSRQKQNVLIEIVSYSVLFMIVYVENELMKRCFPMKNWEPLKI